MDQKGSGRTLYRIHEGFKSSGNTFFLNCQSNVVSYAGQKDFIEDFITYEEVKFDVENECVGEKYNVLMNAINGIELEHDPSIVLRKDKPEEIMDLRTKWKYRIRL